MGALMEYTLDASLHINRGVLVAIVAAGKATVEAEARREPAEPHSDVPYCVLGFWRKEGRARLLGFGLSVCSRGELCPPRWSGCKPNHPSIQINLTRFHKMSLYFVFVFILFI